MLKITDTKEAWLFNLPNGRQAKIRKNSASIDQAAQIMREQWGVGDSLGERPTMDPLGLRDEVEGAGRYVGAHLSDMITGKDTAKSYDHYRGQSKAALEIARFLNPKTMLASDIASGIGVAKPAGVATSVAKEIMTGTGLGAVAGGASGDTFEDRVINGVAGALLGGTLATVAPGLTKGTLAFANIVKRVLKGGGGKAHKASAVQALVKRMEADGVSPDRMLARMRQLGDDAMVLDAGGANVTGGARAAQAQEGPAKQIIKSRLEGRQNMQPQRVADAVGDNLETSGGFNAAVEDVISRRSAEANRNYGPLNGMVVDDFEPLIDLTSRPAVKAAYAAARRMAANKGVELPESIDDALMGGASFDVWDTIKKGLDDVIYSAKRTGQITDPKSGQTSAGVQELQSMQKVRQDLLDVMDTVFPGYRSARDAFAGDTRLLEAAEMGRRFASNDLDLSVDALSKMTLSEREMYRNGVAKALDDIMDRVQDGGNVVRRVFGKPALRKRIRAGFENDTAFRKFQKEMLKEAEKSKAVPQVLGGSPTSRIDAEQAALVSDLADFGINLLTGSPIAAAQGAVRKIVGPGNMSPDASKAIAEVMVAKYPDAQRFLRAAQLRGVMSRGATSAAGQFGGIQGGLLAPNFFGDD